jgi:hypothetical protein
LKKELSRSGNYFFKLIKQQQLFYLTLKAVSSEKGLVFSGEKRPGSAI